MSVTPDDVRQVAALARLAIPAPALATYVDQLNGILQHMEVLQRAAAEGVRSAEPDDLPDAEPQPLRDDVEGSVPLVRSREQFAPSIRDGFFLVPRLASHEDAGAES